MKISFDNEPFRTKKRVKVQLLPAFWKIISLNL